MTEPTDNAGWSAVESALEQVYGDQTPKHWGSAGEWRFGGDVPLRGISAYWNGEAPLPHWHFVTFGLTELFGKMSADAERSGYGFELTLRVAAEEGEAPPPWAIGLLQNLAGYILETGHPFSEGHAFNLQGPLTDSPPTALTGLVFTADPQLPAITSPNGRLSFLQAVALTEDERGAAKAWNTRGILELLAEGNPLWVTELSRESLLSDPAALQRIDAGAARDGSNMAALMVPGLRWTSAPFGGEVTLELPAAVIEDFRRLLAGRLAHGRPLSLAAPDQASDEQVRLVSAERAGVGEENGLLTISLTPALVETLRKALAPSPGVHRLQGLEGLTVRVR